MDIYGECVLYLHPMSDHHQFMELRLFIIYMHALIENIIYRLKTMMTNQSFVNTNIYSRKYFKVHGHC